MGTFEKDQRQVHLRRRFHHWLISQRKKNLLARSTITPPRRLFKIPRSPLAFFFRKIFFLATSSILLAWVVYLIFFSSFFTITKINLEKKGNILPPVSLAPFLDKLKGKNILFLDAESLTRELEQTFQHEILFAELRKSYPHRVIVKIEEYPTVVNLRIISGETTQKFLLNQQGFGISQTQEFKELPVLILRTAKPVMQKSIILEAQKLSPILMALKKFSELFGMKIIDSEWKKTERELHLKTEKNFFVWLDLTANLEAQLSKLKRSLAKLDIYREPLEYIDLRMSGIESEKIIFKRRK